MKATGPIHWLAWLSRLRSIALLALVVALIVSGYLQFQKFEQEATRYRKLAEWCGKSQRIYEGYAQRYESEFEAFSSGRRPKESLEMLGGSAAGSERDFVEKGAALSRETAHHWGRLKGIYERAARFPWATVPLDLQHPRWESELVNDDDGAF